jgi:cbb3-type cytochrome oxidase maturation protein
MELIVILLPIAMVLGATFAVLFVLSARNGQFDDLDDPPERMLRD